ncbi:MAG: rRNA (adenine1518-N6/adenine1519-N6)-dimethyltransferase [Patescibacteria group bacterium]|nr:rRNA (adenine1518-N6/adenine1519-N6)-dimethyltransferase [Patescibacteria group bacterium]
MANIVAEYGIRAKKAFGQNFLVDDAALSSIANAVDVTGKDVIEIGPGYGALTERLLAMNPRSLTLVELDSDMVAILEDRVLKGDLRIPEGTAFEILKRDVLKYGPKFSEYRVIANIPYYITSPILDRFLYELPVRPEAMVILMQKEVAERIVAKDGKESGLSLFCKNACVSIEHVAKVPAGCFRPAPKVDSAVLRFMVDSASTDPKDGSLANVLVRESDSRSDGILQKQPEDGNRIPEPADCLLSPTRLSGPEASPPHDRDADARFLKTVRAGFSSPRKKAVSNLSNGFGIPKESVAMLFAEL